MTTQYQQQHHQHVLQEHNTGTSEGDNVGGHAPPRETALRAGHGEVRARAKIQRVCSSLKINARGSPYTHKNIMNAHVECRWSRPYAHLRGENKIQQRDKNYETEKRKLCAVGRENVAQ